VDIVAALVNELRKMFLGDVLLTSGAVLTVIIVAALLRFGALPAPAAPFFLAIAVIFVLITAVNVSIFKTIRKTGK
jgi:hypothetical protein